MTKKFATSRNKNLIDMLDYAGIIGLGKEFPGKKVNRFMEWFTFSDESIDGKINDREMFMRGIDYSYYYEENE